MRRWISNTVYGVLLPLTAATILLSAVSVVGLSVLHRERVVDTLSQHRVYQAFHDTLPAFVRAISGGDRAAADEFAKVLQEQLTPNVYRGTVEHIVAGLYASPQSPNVSSLPSESAASSPFTSVFPLGQGTAISLLNVLRVIAPISLLLGVLELLGVFATGRTFPSRLRRVSIVLLIPSIPATLVAALLVALPPVLIRETSGTSAGALAPLSVFLSALLQEVGSRLLGVFLVVLPVSLLLLLVSILLDRVRRDKASSPLPPIPSPL